MKKDNATNITGSILSDLRKSTGLTQSDFAKAFNVSAASIAHYEQGITMPTVEMLKMYADYFYVNVDYLLGRCMLNVEYSKLNETIYGNMTILDMVNIVLSLTKDKKHYLFQTLNLLDDKKDKLK